MSTTDIERWSPLKAWLYTLLHKTPKSNVEIIDRIDLGPEDTFLDVGCGPGAALERASLTGASVAGIDPSEAMVQRAAKRVPTATVHVASAEEIPFPDDHFTVAINVSSFHHWADRDVGLREMRRVVAPGGRMYIVEGKIREGKDGHGLDEREAALLAGRLTEIGLENPDVDEFQTGWRHGYFVVSAAKPS